MTREAARQWLRACVERYEERIALYGVHSDPFTLEQVAGLRHEQDCARLALAALEDAERVEWIAQTVALDDVEMWVRNDRWRVALQNAVHMGSGDSLRAAIDEARGET